ncbi:MAG: polymer-forming cytoskeletal protein [Clostridia bacterium]
MFTKKTSGSIPVDTFIGENSTFEGNIKLKETIKVDGKVIGEITAEGDVIIGDSAIISGNIYANNVIVAGSVNGNVTAKNQMRLTVTSKLIGDIKTYSLIIDEGAMFQGNCGMLDRPSEPVISETSNTSPKQKK